MARKTQAPKTEFIPVRVTAAEKVLVTEVAKTQGKSLADFTRQAWAMAIANPPKAPKGK